MNTAINELVKIFLQKDSLQECSIKELQQLADKYPFFSLSQLFLAQKLKAGNTEAFNAQTEKASLFFHHPLQVDQLLTEKGNAVIEQKPAESQLVTAITEETVAPFVTKTDAPESMPYESSAEIPTLPVDSMFRPLEAENPQPVTTGTETPPDQSLHPEPVVDVPTLPDEESEEIVLSGTVEESQAVETVDQIPGLKIEPVDIATAELSFQPYHTVDYFASQGIKFREDEKPKDKFGQQLKSFTEWLKLLKKSPAAEVAATVSTKAEHKIEQLAEHSLSGKEIVTETMAEVWEKQGNREKAILVYRKLSLLNPSKSSYFAAKIEQLKNA